MERSIYLTYTCIKNHPHLKRTTDQGVTKHKLENKSYGIIYSVFSNYAERQAETMRDRKKVSVMSCSELMA